MSQDDQNSCFFAYLDILGFKNLVKHTTFDHLNAIVREFVEGCARTIDLSRGVVTNTGEVYFRGKLQCVFVRIVSDSICVWTEQRQDDDCLKRFDDLIQIVKSMLVYGLSNNLPLRGAVTYGELFSGRIDPPKGIPVDFSFDANSFYGRAVVEAYELESKMNWSGVVLTRNAWVKVEEEFAKGHRMRAANVSTPADLFNHFPELVWYDVPFKKAEVTKHRPRQAVHFMKAVCRRILEIFAMISGCKERAIAINWNYRCKDISVETIEGAFGMRSGEVDETVKMKCRETIRFYEYTACFNGRTKELPIPDRSYSPAYQTP